MFDGYWKYIKKAANPQSKIAGLSALYRMPFRELLIVLFLWIVICPAAIGDNSAISEYVYPLATSKLLDVIVFG